MVQNREVSRSIFREEIILFDVVSLNGVLLLHSREQTLLIPSETLNCFIVVFLEVDPVLCSVWQKIVSTLGGVRNLLPAPTGWTDHNFCLCSSWYVLLKFANQVVFAPACRPTTLLCAHSSHCVQTQLPLQTSTLAALESRKGGKNKPGVHRKNQSPR